jgi:hypothetical protein
VVAVSRDGSSGFFAGLDEGGTGYKSALEGRFEHGSGSRVVIPSIETFLPSAKLVSVRHHGQWGVAQTNCELNLCGSRRRGSKGPAAIEGCTMGRPLQRPDQLLPQHLGALDDGDGGLVAMELALVLDDCIAVRAMAWRALE